MNEFEHTLQEINEQTERELFPQTEALVVIGHSIQKGKVIENWYPSRVAQPIHEMGLWPDGGKKFKRTGERDGRTSEELYASEHTIIGGGILAIAATEYFYNELQSRGREPKLVIYCGGRPGYLDEIDPDQTATEAKIMRREFERKTEMSPDTKAVMFEDNKNTQDDIRTALEEASSSGMTNVTLVAMQIRLPRCEAFRQETAEKNAELGKLEVNLIPAEKLLEHMFNSRGMSDQWEMAVSRFRESEPYERTRGDEEAGYNRAVKDRYTATGNT